MSTELELHIKDIMKEYSCSRLEAIEVISSDTMLSQLLHQEGYRVLYG